MTDTPERPRSKRSLIVAIIVLVVLAATYIGVLKVYDNESQSRSAYIEPETEQAGPNRVDAYVKITSADPVKGDVTVRIDFLPHGDLTPDEGATLSRDLELFVSSATGRQVHEFKKGKRMTPVEAVLDMYEGEPMDYPFDAHKAQLAIYLDPDAPIIAAEAAAAERGEAAPEVDADAEPEATPEAEEEAPATADASPAPAADAQETQLIPIALELFGSVNGLAIEATKAKDFEKDYPVIELTIKRATTARFFSMFIMGAMWLLTVAVLCLVFHVLSGRRKIEVGMFSFLGALLFAFPALRNSQPGTPPIGTYGDFIAFFWAEVLIALCLLTILSIWLVRGPERAPAKPNEPPR